MVIGMTKAIDRLIGARSARSIHAAGGPDVRTIGRMRRGERVRSDAARRLAAVLGVPVQVVIAALGERVIVGSGARR